MPDVEIARQLPKAFNLACARLNWREVESAENKRNWEQGDAQIDWAQTAGLRVCGGPLIDFNDYGIPDWAYLWEGDFDGLRGFMLDHVRRTVKRYRGRVQLWRVAARMCHGRVLSLSEEQRLQIVAQAIATAREVDSRTPVVISFDQPWGEYLANEKLDLAPLHFADALVRADLGLSGLGLEINAGYHPRGSSHYSPLALSRLIDYWSMLDLPLLVSLTVPSSATEDPQADGKIRVLGDGDANNVTPTSQSEWVRRHVPLLFAKASVQLVMWNQLTDARPHEFPHGGLFDADWQPKPALAALAQLRGEYLM